MVYEFGITRLIYHLGVRLSNDQLLKKTDPNHWKRVIKRSSLKVIFCKKTDPLLAGRWGIRGYFLYVVFRPSFLQTAN